MRFRWWFRWVDVERDEKEGGMLAKRLPISKLGLKVLKLKGAAFLVSVSQIVIAQVPGLNLGVKPSGEM